MFSVRETPQGYSTNQNTPVTDKTQPSSVVSKVDGEKQTTTQRTQGLHHGPDPITTRTPAPHHP